MPGSGLRDVIRTTITAMTCVAALQASTGPATTGDSASNDRAKDRERVAVERLEHVIGNRGKAGPPDDPYARVRLPMGDSSSISLVRSQPPTITAEGITWVGRTEQTGERAMLMLRIDGRLSGYFGHRGKIYVVSQDVSGMRTMVEHDPTLLPPDHGGPPDAVRAPLKPEPQVMPLDANLRLSLESRPITIDLMMLYTPAASAHYLRSPTDLLSLLVGQTNDMLRASGLGHISIRLVHTAEIAFKEDNRDHFDMLYQLVDRKGAFKDVSALRNVWRADIVGLVVDNPRGCGLSTRVSPDAEDAYFVVHHACAAVTYSIAHEIGHILGARHDRGVDSTEQPAPYAHGYVHENVWRDVMSYRQSCGGCPRQPFWSNPRIMFNGVPTGTHASDNARIILEQAERVSRFR